MGLCPWPDHLPLCASLAAGPHLSRGLLFYMSIAWLKLFRRGTVFAGCERAVGPEHAGECMTSALGQKGSDGDSVNKSLKAHLH